MRLTLPRAVATAAALACFAFAGSAGAASQCAQAASSAQDLRAAGKLIEARAQLAICAQKSCNNVVRADCEKWIGEVDEQTPTIIIRPLDARGNEVLGATVTIDGNDASLDGKPVKVNPGKRKIRVTAKSGDVADQKTLVAQGEKNRIIEVKFDTELGSNGKPVAPAAEPSKAEPKEEPEKPAGPPPPPAEKPSNVAPITLAAIGGAAMIAFLFFEITGQSDYSDLQSGCGNTPAGCSDNQKGPVKTKFVAAGISLGISLAAVTAAAVLYVVRKPASPAATSLLTRGITF